MSSTGRRTFPWDLVRGAADGMLLAAPGTFALLIAIRYFEATALQKSIIAGSFSAGLILSIVYASWSPAVGRRNTLRGALPSVGTALGLLTAAFAHRADVYTLGIALAGISSRLSVPIMTGIYRYNYHGSVRGQVFGLTVLVTASVTLLTNLVGGHVLDRAIENFRPLLVAFAVMAGLGGFSISRMPPSGKREPVLANPFSCFAVIRQHPLFGYVLAAWFLFGFANLTMMPQRFEYLSQAQYGFRLSPGMLVLVLGVTSEAIRLPMILIWGRLFDRFNFIHLRVILNTLLLGYLILFFHSKSLAGVAIGSCLLGAGLAGGSIAWNLWVTKFAAPHETSKYMAVHTFLTGFRGTFGPFLGYFLVEHFGLSACSWVAAALVTLSILMLWPIRKLATRVGGNPEETLHET